VVSQLLVRPSLKALTQPQMTDTAGFRSVAAYLNHLHEQQPER
jgi:hypothetical protein